MNRRAKHYYVLTITVAGAAAALVWLALARFAAVLGAGPPPALSQRANSTRPSPGVSARRYFPVGIAKSSREPLHVEATALPATLSQAQINAVKLPKGFVLAQIPWLREVNQPVPAFVAQARLPWLQNSNQPLPVFVALARLPWANCRVTTLRIPHPPQRWGLPDCKFVMALCRDRQGNIWIATEGSGIFRYDPAAPKDKRWTQFTKQNTQGQLANDNIYALACDNRGRIWAGELNHGISVYNGSHWQNYDIVQNPKRNVLAGPLGNHVFALKFDKYTDQMWACTDAGISIYQCSPSSGTVTRNPSLVTFASGTWHYITQANGLPQNPDCLAFSNNGTVYAGTQCDGIAVGTPDRARSTNNGQQAAPSHKAAGSAGGGISNNDLAAGLPYCAPYRWRVVTGPWKMPLTAFGHGLPSNLINTISAGPNGELVAGTDGGIAFSKPASPAGRSRTRSPKSWTFERGQDFPAKVLGLWHPPQHWQPPSPETLESLPMEDYTTAVAFSDQRSLSNVQHYSNSQLLTSSSFVPDLWLAHRIRGIDVWQYNATGKIISRLQIHEPQIGNYVTSLLPLPGGAMAVGMYGKGISIITIPGESDQRKHPANEAANGAVPEPHGAAPPSRRQLAALAAHLVEELKTASHKQPAVVALGDDWRTEGGWLGRYGKFWIELAAVCSPYDFVWGAYKSAILYAPKLAEPIPGAGPRYWVAQLQSTNPRALELPATYMDSRVKLFHIPRDKDRRIASIDDHGEATAMSSQGPGLFVTLRVPPGRFILSAYLWNNDGHFGADRYRDYIISVRRHPSSDAFDNTRSFHREPTLALGRIAGFHGGAWKRFLVRGPIDLTVRFGRNHSFNTIFSALSLDSIHQYASPYFGRTAPKMGRVAFRPPLAAPWSGSAARGKAPDAAIAAGRLLRLLAAARRSDVKAFTAFVPAFGMIARVLRASRAAYRGDGRVRRNDLQALAICFWDVAFFRRAEGDQRAANLLTAREIEKSLRWSSNRVSHVNEDYDKIREFRQRCAVRKIVFHF